MYYAYMDSPVGKIFVAGDDATLRVTSFTRGHQARRPEPDWKRDAAPLAYAIDQLSEYFEGDRTEFDLPVTMHGTPFQLEVWDVLRTIRFGETLSYGQVAARIGRPAASRAVGAANGANHLPIVVPCHRVIGADGTLTGFGGGLDAKRWLLDFEGAAPQSRQVALF